MTAAFAKEIGVPIRYQMVLGDAVGSRSGGMYFSISHVNLTLGALQGGRILDNQSAPLTIDFLPGGRYPWATNTRCHRGNHRRDISVRVIASER
jgi:hypothetical protein